MDSATFIWSHLAIKCVLWPLVIGFHFPALCVNNHERPFVFTETKLCCFKPVCPSYVAWDAFAFTQLKEGGHMLHIPPPNVVFEQITECVWVCLHLFCMFITILNRVPDAISLQMQPRKDVASELRHACVFKEVQVLSKLINPLNVGCCVFQVHRSLIQIYITVMAWPVHKACGVQ